MMSRFILHELVFCLYFLRAGYCSSVVEVFEEQRFQDNIVRDNFFFRGDKLVAVWKKKKIF